MMTGDVTCQEARQNGALTHAHAPDLRSVSSALICLAGWLNQQHAITARWGPCSCCLVRVFRNCTEALDTAGTSQSLAQAKVPRDWRPNPSYGAARKRWLARGEDVCIFTARVNPNHQQGDAVRARRGIEAWCERYLGQILPVTYEKDWDMVLLLDDRARQVEHDTGRIFCGHPCEI